MAARKQIDVALAQAYRGGFMLVEMLVQDGLKIDHRVANDIFTKTVLARAYIHRGKFLTGGMLAKEFTEMDNRINQAESLRLLSWVALSEEEYSEALALASRSEEISKSMIRFVRECVAWAKAPSGLAYYCLGQVVKAKRTLFEALQTCVAIRAFLPLMHLLPVIPVVLAEEGDEQLKERAVEVYAVAESLPYVNNSQLFKTITRPRIREVVAQLLPETIHAAKTRGRTLDVWETAAALLVELRELGWNNTIDKEVNDASF